MAPASRELPDRTKIKEVTFDPDCSHGDRARRFHPATAGRGRRCDAHAGVQLQRHGQDPADPGQSGTVVISSEDGSPVCPVVFNAPTSRIRIGEIYYP